jgi:RHS repeat-associated protein
MGRVIATYYLDGVTTREEAIASAIGAGTLQTATRYDRAGQVTDSYDAHGNRTRYEYDNAGRRTKVIAPGAKPATVRLNAKGDALSFNYNEEGESDNERTVISEYDDGGNLVKETDPEGRSTRHIYDALNRRTAVTLPDGTRQRTEYDALGRRTKTIDAEGKETLFGYNEAGQLATVTDAEGGVTSYTYDSFGRQVTQTDAEGKTTTYTYNETGQRATRTLPGGQTETYGYNPDGSLAFRKDFNGETVKYSYDGYGRLVKRTPSAAALARGAVNATFTYNAAGERIEQTLTDANGINQWWETYGYDNYGRLIQKRTPAGDIGYLYDAAGNLTTLATSHGTELHYDYDQDNRLVEVEDRTGITSGDGRITKYAFTPSGSLKTVTLPNGAVTTYDYSLANRLQQMTTLKGATTLASFVYELRQSGHRSSLTERIGSAQIYGEARRTEWQYDNLYRLTKETVTTAGTGQTIAGEVQYTHDKVGNRLSRLVSGTGILPVLPGVSSYTYDLNDRLLSTDARNYTYDANGNTRTGSVGGAGVSPASRSGTGILPVIPVTDQYDDQNRLVQRTETENGKTITILYDADGNRVAKTVNGITTYYLVDSQNPTGYAQVIEEITAPAGVDPIANGTVTKRYAYGLDLIGQQVWTTGDQLTADHWKISYYGYDGLGSVRYLTDETAFITDRYTYDAFGTLLDVWSANELTPADNVYLYVGEQFDPDLGLYYNRARYLNTDTDRFWSMDTYEGNNKEPLSLHKYLYVHGNPVNSIDPSGNMTMADVSSAMNILSQLNTSMLHVLRVVNTVKKIADLLYMLKGLASILEGEGIKTLFVDAFKESQKTLKKLTFEMVSDNLIENAPKILMNATPVWGAFITANYSNIENFAVYLPHAGFKFPGGPREIPTGLKVPGISKPVKLVVGNSGSRRFRITGAGIHFGRKLGLKQIWRMDFHGLHPNEENNPSSWRSGPNNIFQYHIEKP